MFLGLRYNFFRRVEYLNCKTKEFCSILRFKFFKNVTKKITLVGLKLANLYLKRNILYST